MWKVNGRRTPSDGKSSRCLWQGELKKVGCKQKYIPCVPHKNNCTKNKWFTQHETDRFLNNHCQECVPHKNNCTKNKWFTRHETDRFLNKMNCELMLTYDTPALRQTGSRNLTGQKMLPRYGVPIWSLWPNIRFLPSIVAEKNATKNEHICSMCIKINKVSKQEVGIWWVQKRFLRYGVPISSLWPNIRSLPSIVAEKNVTKNVHICSMCIKTN